MARRKKKSAEYTKQDNGSIGLSKAALEALDTGTYGKMTNRTPTATRSEDQIKVVQRVPALRGMKTVTPKQNTERRTERKTTSYSPSYKTEKKEKRGTSYTPMYNNMIFTGKKNEKVDNKVVNDVSDKKKKLDVSIDNDLKQITDKQKKADASVTKKTGVLSTRRPKEEVGKPIVDTEKARQKASDNHTPIGRSLSQKDADLIYNGVFDMLNNNLSAEEAAERMRGNVPLGGTSLGAQTAAGMTGQYVRSKDWEKEYGKSLETLLDELANDQNAFNNRTEDMGDRGGAISKTLGSIYLNAAAKPLFGAKAMANSLVRPESEKSENADRVARSITGLSNSARESVADRLGTVGGTVYNVGTGLADRMIPMLMNKYAGAGLTALRTAEDQRESLEDRGVSKRKAAVEGLGMGAVDAALDIFGLEKIKKLNTLRESGNIVKAALGSGAIGGGEQFITSAINQAIDTIANGEDSVFENNVNAYKEQGMSDNQAVTKALGDSVLTLLKDAGQGALFGGIMGTGGRIARKGADAALDAITGRKIPSLWTPTEPIENAVRQSEDAAAEINRLAEQIPEVPEKLQPELEIPEETPEVPINRAVAETENPRKLQTPLEKLEDEDIIEDVLPEINTRQYSDAELAEIRDYVERREALKAENSKNVNPTDLVAMTKFNELRAQGKAMDAEMAEKYPELFDDRGKFTGIPEEITDTDVNIPKETPVPQAEITEEGVNPEIENVAGGYVGDTSYVAPNQYRQVNGRTVVGRATIIPSEYTGTDVLPIQSRQNTDYHEVSPETYNRAVDSINNARAKGEDGVASRLKQIYKGLFGSNDSYVRNVDNLTVNGKPYDVTVYKNVVAKALGEKASPEKLSVLEDLDEIIGKSNWVGSGDNAKGKQGVSRYDYFEKPVTINGKNYLVTYSVEVRPGENKYRTHAIIDEMKIQQFSNDTGNNGPGAKTTGLTTEELPSDSNITPESEIVNNGEITQPDVNSPHTKTSEAYTNTGRRGGGWIGDEYKKYTDPKQFQYEDSNEKETVNNAIKMRETEGREGFKNRVMEQERLTASEVDGLMMEWRNLTSEARDLDKIGAKSQDKWDEAVRVFRKVQEQASSNAQALQALAKWSRNTPEGLLAQAENILNGRVKVDKSAPQKLIEKFTKSGKKFQFEDHFVKEFLQEAQDIPRLDPDSREANIKMSKLGELINDQMPSTLGEKVTTWLMDSMLGNFRTLIARNAGGNVGLAAVEQLAQRPLAAGIDTLVSKKTGRRTQAGLSLEGLNDYIHGFAKGIRDEISDIGTGLHTARSGENTLERAIQANRHVFKKGGILDEYDNRIKNGLSFGDRNFYEGVYKQTLGDYNRLRAKGVMGEAIQNLSDEQFKQYSEAAAKLNALAAVYQNDSKISEAMLKFKNAVGDLSRGAFGVDILSQFSMPFVKTPANVVNVGIDYSPLGAVRNTVKTINEVKNGAFDQNRFVNETARNIIGTGLMGGAYAMAKNGKINGAYSEDTDEKQAQKEAGEQEYALNLPGGYQMDIGWLPVVGSNAVAAAAAQDAASKGNGNAVSNFLKGLAKGGETMFDQSMFQGLQRLMGGDGNYDSDAGLVGNLKNTVEQGIGQAIPSLLRQVGQVEDDYQRDLANSNKGLGFEKAYNFNSLLNSIPTVRELGLAPKVETTGELAKQNQGRSTGMKILEDMILPGKISKVEYSALNEEAQRLKDATDSADAYMPKAARKNFDTEDHILSNKEWTEAQQKYYKGMTDVGTKLMESEEYKSADTDTQLKTMKKAYDGIKQAVQCEYNGKEPTDAVAKAYTNAGGGEKGVQAAFDYCRQSMSGAAVEQQTGLKGNTTANQMIQEDIANGDQTAADEKIRAAEIIGKSFKVPSVTSTYYQVQTKVPELTPEKYVDVYKKIDVNGSQDVQQGELEKYINMMFGEKDKEKAEAYWEGFYDHKKWKNKAEQEKKLVWENGKYVSKYPKK